MKSVRKWATLFVLAATMGAQAYAMSTLKGTIVDQKTKEPLIGATVQIVGTSTGAITDFDGNYVLNVEDGVYDIEIKYMGYETAVRKQVEVVNNKVVTMDLELSSDMEALQEVQVVAKASRESENVTMLEQRRSVVAVQAVGAKELSRKGASDAEDAVAKVSGISKQEGVKNVFVRGLGDRYNVTTLNGFPMPSEDPEYKNIALDLFSTDIIQSVGVNKAFNAGGQADVAGASIDILSKELIGKSAFGVDVSGGVNTSTVGNKNFLKLDGVNGMGFVTNPNGPAATNDAFNAKDFGFQNALNPTVVGSPLMDYSAGISGGKKIEMGDDALYFFLVASHSQQFESYEDEVRDATSTGDVYRDQKGQRSSIATNQLALATLSYNLNKKHNIAYNFMMIHANNQSVIDFEGMNSETYQSAEDYGYMGFTRRQQTNDNMLFVNQLTSKWELTKKVNLEVGASYNSIHGTEPDRRINSIAIQDDENNYQPTGKGTQMRYYSDLQENDMNVRAGLTFALNDNYDEISNIKVGYQGRFLQDDFSATEFSFGALKTRYPWYGLDNVDFDDMFNQERLNNGDFSILSPNLDLYTVNKTIHSGYAEGTYQFASNFIANVGVKADKIVQTIAYDLVAGGDGEKTLDPFYFLPSLNLRYNMNDKNTLRLGASKTYTLPQSKEISPFRYTGVSFNSQGNADLQPSTNYNVDLKWDYYMTPNELLSVTAFYKYIKDPISRIDIGSSGGFLSYENIAPFATVAGVELELRKNLFSQAVGADGLNKLSAGINASYIYTNAEVELATTKTGSQLEGAAPWIVNADLTHLYRKGDRCFTNTIVFNYFSDRVYTIGANGFNDIVERGVPTLDFVSSADLNKSWSIKLKATNLLNSTNELSRDGADGGQDVILSRYKKGINISLGASYKF